MLFLAWGRNSALRTREEGQRTAGAEEGRGLARGAGRGVSASARKDGGAGNEGGRILHGGAARSLAWRQWGHGWGWSGESGSGTQDVGSGGDDRGGGPKLDSPCLSSCVAEGDWLEK